MPPAIPVIASLAAQAAVGSAIAGTTLFGVTLSATAGLTTLGGALFTAITTTAGAIAGYAASMLVAPDRPKAVANIESGVSQRVVKNPTSPRSTIYGRARVSGTLVAFFTTGEENETAHMVIAIADHEIEEVEQIRIGDRTLDQINTNSRIEITFNQTEFYGLRVYFANHWFTADGDHDGPLELLEAFYAWDGYHDAFFTVTATESTLTITARDSETNLVGRVGKGRVQGRESADSTAWVSKIDSFYVSTVADYKGGTFAEVTIHHGADDQVADPDLMAAVSAWTDKHRLQGIAYAYVRLKYDLQVFPRGIPGDFTFDLKGKKVYDPRDPNQSSDDKSTHKYSANAVLCTRDYCYGSHGWNYRDDQLDDDINANSATVSDQQIAADLATGWKQSHNVVESSPGALLKADPGHRAFASGFWDAGGVQKGNLSPGADFNFYNPYFAAKREQAFGVRAAGGTSWNWVSMTFGWLSEIKDGNTMTLWVVEQGMKVASFDCTADRPLKASIDYIEAEGRLTWSLSDGRSHSSSKSTDQIRALFPLERVLFIKDLTDYAATVSGVTTHARYEINGVVVSNVRKSDQTERLLSAFGGSVTQIGGVYAIRVASYSTPVTDLTEDDFAGPLNIVPTVARGDGRFNTVAGVYRSEANGWTTTDFEPVSSQDYIDEDNGEVLRKDIELPFTNDHNRAQQTSKLSLERSRRSLMFSAQMKLSMMPLALWDNVRITNGSVGWDKKVFKVISYDFSFEDGLNMTFQEDDIDAYAWSALDIATYNPEIRTNLATPWHVSPPFDLGWEDDQYTRSTTTDGHSDTDPTLIETDGPGFLVWSSREGSGIAGYEIRQTPARGTVVSQSPFKLAVDELGAPRTYESRSSRLDVSMVQFEPHIVEVEGVATTYPYHLVQVRAINAVGVHSDWSKSIAIKVLPPPIPPSVTGLEQDLGEEVDHGGENSTTSRGRHFRIRWRHVRATAIPELGDEVFGIGEGGMDPHFRDYRIVVYDVETGVELRTAHTVDNAWTYTFEMNRDDFIRTRGRVGAFRKVAFDVLVRGHQGQLSESA